MTPPDAHPSPNCGPRRGGALPSLIVLHYTAMYDSAAAIRHLCNPAAEVSAHYLIDDAGGLHSLVPEALRAWHAGAGAWGQVGDVNSHSIGIELSNTGDTPFAARQIRALTGLLADLRARWGIPPERVIGHSDMAPGRKIDPGLRFDWRGLALAGHSVWPDPIAPLNVEPVLDGFTAAARAFGYPGVAPDLMLAAFRLRFRPGVQGPVDARDMAMIADLAARFPVDATARTA